MEIKKVAEEIQEAIWIDLTDRREIHQAIDNIDEEILEEIKTKQISIIKAILERVK